VHEQQQAMLESILLGVFLIPIIFYKFIAWLSSFGFMEMLARDHGSENHPGPYAFFFWILFILTWLFLIFDWSLY